MGDDGGLGQAGGAAGVDVQKFVFEVNFPLLLHRNGGGGRGLHSVQVQGICKQTEQRYCYPLLYQDLV